uniref:[histone H3]-trimethyl-L-lysine(4) demethylase n=1 Tax=Gadus morhua TaxID=8049 RepID=A0A8C5FJF6_GADMO
MSMGPPQLKEFVSPPECPVFEPSREEFSDPFAYINKIRAIAEKTGICKVRPPPEWQPPFACDVDRLQFTPRIQRLNELEAQTRVKLNFLDQIAKFWELQGCTLKIPHVERKILDLYLLNRLVNEEGGFDAVCRERRWSRISVQMGFAPGKAIGSHLRAHYERILYPYKLFKTGANLLVDQYMCLVPVHRLSPLSDPRQVDQYMCLVPVHRLSPLSDPRQVDQYMCLVPVHRLSPLSDSRQVDQYMCLVCGCGTAEDRLLLCDGCDDSYHTFCLIPPLHDVPKGDWRCPKCLAQECGKPPVAFGFEQASRNYNLRTFGDMADSFKSDYFNMPVHMVPTELVEKEFWRLVSTIEEDVTVEYGADIASKEFGSGFPVKNGQVEVSGDDETYLTSGWNLNNMPVLDASVLTHVTADICGMKLPWLYVGMCFSSFCWHIEDHWSYSINYLHWGEPKTWYGAPGSAATQLEGVMKKLAPELFESQPDLLHQLVTIMNPNTLMNNGVELIPFGCAGEFVITFPRAYHSGFNQGFNFAEAVNFCTMDWMPIGRQCVDHYRQLSRYCVFSHDEMVCNMAAKADHMEVELASAVQKEMAVMIQEEEELRGKVNAMGVSRSQQVDYELLPDEERQCLKCRTTCYLSGITCPCSPGKLVCLHHAQDLCSCPPSGYTLCKFTLATLYPMMAAVKHRAESFKNWVASVQDILETKANKKRGLEELRSLVEQAEAGAYPKTDLQRQLRALTLDAEKCASMAQQLLNGKRQTRYRSGGGRTQSQNELTVEELRSFVTQLDGLPCVIRQAPLLKDLLTRVDDFRQQSERLLSDEAPSAAGLQELLDVSLGLDVELPQLPLLRERLEQARWLEGAQRASGRPDSLCLDTMRRLIDQGVGLAPHGSVERAMARLQELLTVSEQWEERALSLMEARPFHSMETLEDALQEVENIPAFLPNCMQLKEVVLKAKDWLQEVEALQVNPWASVVQLTPSADIPVWLDPLTRLEALLADVQTWKESAAKTFLVKNSSLSLLEVLTPRCDVGAGSQKSRSKKSKEASPGSRRDSAKLDSLSEVERALLESKDSASADVRQSEMEVLLALRAANESKLLSAADGSEELSVCLCHKGPSGGMLQCELCRDVFHSDCVTTASELEQDQAWLCPLCQRSRKPPLDRVLPLLASLQRIRVRLPEGDALRFLIERTVRWQHRVQMACTDGLLDDLAGVGVAGGKVRRVGPGLWWPPLVVVLPYVVCSPLASRRVSVQNGSSCHKKDSGKSKRTKRRKDSTDSHPRDRVKKSRKKKSKSGKEKSPEVKRSPSPSNTPSETLPSDPLASDSEDEEEDYSLCAAPWCREPGGDEVNWVQCDGTCNQWFHQVCVGVSAAQAEKDDYICISCTQPDYDRGE